MKYEIIVDFGKPYIQYIYTEEQLKKFLKKLKKQYDKEKDDNGYFDIRVINEKGEDVTQEKFDQYEKYIYGGKRK